MVDQPKSESPQTRIQSESFFLIIVFVALGIFATTLPQPQVLGKIPLQHLLKTDLNVSRSQMAEFFLVCGLFWYLGRTISDRCWRIRSIGHGRRW